jgi:hypothetical protein
LKWALGGWGGWWLGEKWAVDSQHGTSVEGSSHCAQRIITLSHLLEFACHSVHAHECNSVCIYSLSQVENKLHVGV